MRESAVVLVLRGWKVPGQWTPTAAMAACGSGFFMNVFHTKAVRKLYFFLLLLYFASLYFDDREAVGRKREG